MSRLIPVLGVLLFCLGLVLAAMLALVALWPDLEASLFDPSLLAEESLDNLRCPILVTTNENAVIRATFDNPFDRPVAFPVRMRIAQGHVTLMRQVNEMVELEAGASQELRWLVSPDDAAFGRLILARVYAPRRHPLPARQQSCGIFVLNVSGISGSQATAVSLATSLLSTGVGAILWLRHERPLAGSKRDLARTVCLLAILILSAMFVSLMGWWVIGVLLFAAVVLLLATMIERFLH